MITRITIDNFQSHKHTEFDLSEGVNAIIGPSDSGKSSVLRAMNWTINNQPSGEAYRSHWVDKEPTKVSLLLNSGDVISRVRTKSDNYYELNGNKFHSFGTGVPEEIKGILNVQGVNIQSQLAPPFLLIGSSPGEVGRYFNNIVNLDIIDKAISNGNRKITRLRNSKADAKARSEQLTLELDELDWVDEADGYLAGLEKVQQDLKGLRQQHSFLTSRLIEIKHIEVQLKPLFLILQTKHKVELLFELAATNYETKITARDILALINNIRATEQRLEKHKQLISAKSAFVSLCDLDDNITELIEKEKALGGLIDNIIDVRSACNTANQNIEKYRKQLPDVCPTCGQEVDSWESLNVKKI